MTSEKPFASEWYEDALDIVEIAAKHRVDIETVNYWLREAQNSGKRTIISDKFKAKVARFCQAHPDISFANVARTYYLKDERGIRDWVKEYGNQKPKEDKQHSLLEPVNMEAVWKKRYEGLLNLHTTTVWKLKLLIDEIPGCSWSKD